MIPEFQHTNLAYLEQMTEGDQTLQRQMLSVLLRELETEIPRLRELQAAANWPEVRQVSHRFRTTLDYVGNRAMQQANDEIERLAEGGADLKKIAALIGQLEASLVQVLPELKRALAERGTA